LLTRTLAGLVFATFLTTGAASASSFVTPEPMTAKLGPSMILLGEPAAKQMAASDRPDPAETVAAAIDKAPLDYPFPGGAAPIRVPGKVAVETPLNYPAPAGEAAGTSSPSASEVTFVRISASIVAMAETEPVVSFEHVAAVGKDSADNEADRRNPFDPLPTVIRGGVVDDGGSAEASVPAAPVKKPAAMAPRQSASSSPQPSKEPDAPVPLPTPAPPPANIIPQTKVR
jgi:hypothetical protein